MKKLYFWTWAFIIAGIITLVGSSFWFLKYPNLSEYFIYLSGVIILWVFAGFCEALKKIIGKQTELEGNQRELQRWATEQEKKKEGSE